MKWSFLEIYFPAAVGSQTCFVAADLCKLLRLPKSPSSGQSGAVCLVCSRTASCKATACPRLEVADETAELGLKNPRVQTTESEHMSRWQGPKYPFCGRK